MQKWLTNQTPERIAEIVELHEDFFHFDGGVSWGGAYTHPNGVDLSVKVHDLVAPQLTEAEQSALVESLPEDWIPVINMNVVEILGFMKEPGFEGIGNGDNS